MPIHQFRKRSGKTKYAVFANQFEYQTVFPLPQTHFRDIVQRHPMQIFVIERHQFSVQPRAIRRGIPAKHMHRLLFGTVYVAHEINAARALICYIFFDGKNVTAAVKIRALIFIRLVNIQIFGAHAYKTVEHGEYIQIPVQIALHTFAVNIVVVFFRVVIVEKRPV